MTCMPASRRARATTLTPRPCPSSPTLASTTRMGMVVDMLSVPGPWLAAVPLLILGNVPGLLPQPAGAVDDQPAQRPGQVQPGDEAEQPGPAVLLLEVAHARAGQEGGDRAHGVD